MFYFSITEQEIFHLSILKLDTALSQVCNDQLRNSGDFYINNNRDCPAGQKALYNL